MRRDIEDETKLICGFPVILFVFSDPHSEGVADVVTQTERYGLFCLEIYDLIVGGYLILRDQLHHHVLVDIVALIVEDDCDSQKIHQFALEVACDWQVVGVINDQLDDWLYFTLFDQFFVIGVHLLEEIDASNIVRKMALCNFQDVFKLLLVINIVPDQNCQEIVSSMQGSHGQETIRGQLAHDLDEINDQKMVVLTLNEVLIQDQVLIFFGDDEI